MGKAKHIGNLSQHALCSQPYALNNITVPVISRAIFDPQ